MIITGGFNVYSVEVEQALMQHSAVQDCAVVGLPDDKWGERVTAVVQPYPGGSVAAADLRSFVKDRIGSVKRSMAGPAPVEGRQGPQRRGQVPPARPGAAHDSGH
jgi:acyl-CoA synthetase (AMP-forming)/AMP-acid ligase II